MITMETQQCTHLDYSNISNARIQDFEVFLYNQREQFFVGILMPIILVPGILGNIAFLVVYQCVRRMKTRTNIYLANLAVADVFYLLFGVGEKVLSLYLSAIRYDSLKLSSVWCYTVLPFVKMCAYASMFFVTMVTVDKFFAVCHPFRVRRSSKRRYRLFLMPIRFVIGGWVTALVCATTSIPALGKMIVYCIVWPSNDQFASLPNQFGICSPFYPWSDAFSNLFQITLFFSVLFPNVYMYMKIIYTLHLRVKSAVRRDTQLRNYVARMLVINGSIFFLCTMPFYFFSLAYHVADVVTSVPVWMTEMLKVVRPISQALLYLNSCINPLIYNVANPRYRTAFSETFKCEKVRRHQGQPKTCDTTVYMRAVNKPSNC